MMSVIHLVPANGRDYSNQAEVKADFKANKDFLLVDPTSQWDGKPINRGQIASAVVIVRYCNGRKTVQVKPS
jgi:hypothetical protein